MDDDTTEDRREALRPIASLISKSEKAQQKVAPGTWQHTMLRDNLAALHIASALMDEHAEGAGEDFTPDELRNALSALASMVDRTEKALPKFAPGTPQHSLLRNRLKALRVAEALTKAELDSR